MVTESVRLFFQTMSARWTDLRRTASDGSSDSEKTVTRDKGSNSISGNTGFFGNGVIRFSGNIEGLDRVGNCRGDFLIGSHHDILSSHR